MPPNAATPWTAGLGNAATPQRTWQVHAPPAAVVPWPVTIEAVLLAAAAVAEAATEAVVAVAGAALPPAMGAVVPVPFWAIAMLWNIAWVLLAVGLMEKVIPFPQ